LIPVGSLKHHSVFDIVTSTGASVLQVFPDHMHEGEVLGFDGVGGVVPWTLNEMLTFTGQSFTEYPSQNRDQKKPQIIATGHVVGGHISDAPQNPPITPKCPSGDPFDPDPAVTAKDADINISVYDGHNVGVGHVLTDSLFHHFIDLNVVGDPCAGTEELNGLVTHKEELAAFYRNVALWLANPKDTSSRWIIGSVSRSSTWRCMDSHSMDMST
jgi:hypothetical protein